jgi:hypothetical protein
VIFNKYKFSTGQIQIMELSEKEKHRVTKADKKCRNKGKKKKRSEHFRTPL